MFDINHPIPQALIYYLDENGKEPAYSTVIELINIKYASTYSNLDRIYLTVLGRRVGKSYKLQGLLQKHKVSLNENEPLTLEQYSNMLRDVKHMFGDDVTMYIQDCFIPTGEPVDPGYEDSLSHYVFNYDTWEDFREECISHQDV